MDHRVMKTLKYWRNTLADGARIEIGLDKVIHLRQGKIDIEHGFIETAQAITLINQEEWRFNKANGIEDPKDQNWQQLKEVSVLISLFHVNPIPEYAKLTGEAGPFYPFWIKAVLTKEGKLRLDEDTFPYIPRVNLEPQVNDKVNFIFSNVELVDTAFAEAFGEKDWSAYWEYIQHIFGELTDQKIQQYDIQNFLTEREYVIVVNNVIQNPADAIIQLYDFLLKNKLEPSLLKKLCDPTTEKLKDTLSLNDFEMASVKHLGQMGFEYPLSFSQRNSLYHFNEEVDGGIFAINGPPGTGKTTLVQSVVANEVVMAAIEGEDPRIIVACSTNNQAVTNINESFRKTKVKQGVVYERWISGVTSFALYLPSKRKVIDADTLYYKSFDDGFRSTIETLSFVNSAKTAFCEKFEQYAGFIESVAGAVAHLRNKLVDRQRKLASGIVLWRKFKEIGKLIDILGADRLTLFPGYVINVEALDDIQQNLSELEVRIYDYFKSESIWIVLFSFLPFVKEKRVSRLKQIFRTCSINYGSIDFYKIKSFHEFFDVKNSLLRQIKAVNQEWVKWKSAHSVIGNPPSDEIELKNARKNFFYDELEMGIKNEMFFLAIHYWEGRWIMETEIALNGRIEGKGQGDTLDRFKRLAMLTPCFVSTFYMAPKFFSYFKLTKKLPSRNIWEQPPLLEAIDLLVVDEAGQASPEVGAATFALAKRAIVVGDTKQIEPVWNVPRKVDYANLERYGLIVSKDSDLEIQNFDKAGFLGSSGSIMKLAQKSSSYKIHLSRDRGFLLTEHRRCYNEIIGYCNALAYDGQLEPMRGRAKGTVFRPMNFIPVQGESYKVNSSKANNTEAQAISDWLTKNAQKIIGHYQNDENESAKRENRTPKKVQLSDVIGILTPFAAQKLIIKSFVQNAGISTSGLTIGTVHALQGAERPIILFSTVYGLNNLGNNYFFDQGVNMLNVAVSRAKDCFFLFGCLDIFEGKSNAPSSKLFNHIRAVNHKIDTTV